MQLVAYLRQGDWVGVDWYFLNRIDRAKRRYASLLRLPCVTCQVPLCTHTHTHWTDVVSQLIKTF